MVSCELFFFITLVRFFFISRKIYVIERKYQRFQVQKLVALPINNVIIIIIKWLVFGTW